MDDFTFGIILRNLLAAARWTLALTAIALTFGAAGGVAVTFLRVSPSARLRRISAVYIEILQGTPMLMQLFLCFFGLSFLGINLPPFAAGSVVLTLYASAHLAEIWRGCAEALPRGQWEASAALSLTYFQQMRRVILPQAFRLAIPSTVGFLVQIVKGTALVSSIGLVEVTKAGAMMTNVTFRPFLIYGLVAAIYFALCYPLSLFSQHLERKIHVPR